MSDDFVIEMTPVEEIPPENETIAKASWIPTEDELINIRNQWRTQGGSGGPHAGSRSCAKCGNWAYCYGSSYEKQICLACFTEKMRPKRKYTRRA